MIERVALSTTITSQMGLKSTGKENTAVSTNVVLKWLIKSIHFFLTVMKLSQNSRLTLLNTPLFFEGAAYWSLSCLESGRRGETDTGLVLLSDI